MNTDVSMQKVCPTVIDGGMYAAMIRGGAAALRAHRQEINDLNVFPIPDGDTGDNMLMTAEGGVRAAADSDRSLSAAARCIAGGMLLGARGNSGVILSQLFDGIARDLTGAETADAPALAHAFDAGVKQAYAAVLNPAEGTILTVAREASTAAARQAPDGLSAFFNAFLTEANASLDRTPDLLPVLRDAGVVDSGGAGLVRMIEGMAAALRGADPDDLSVPDDLSDVPTADRQASTAAETVDLDAFGPDSTLTFGYCTELLLRLQTAKCNPDSFDVSVITDYLNDIGGNSVAAFRTGSVVKLHVHTMTPDLVLGFCRRFGEFLTVKIENMSLQHSAAAAQSPASAAGSTDTGLIPGQAIPAPGGHRKPFGVVVTACGEGIKSTFTEMGADCVVDGGQSMNPSAEAFLEAFRSVNAEHIIVLPNNGNVILTARQAAAMYADVRKDTDVRVLETRTVGEGYAALSMMDTSSGDPDTVLAGMREAIEGVITACVSECVRESDFRGTVTHPGQHIGFVGKDILSVGDSRTEAACRLCDALDAEGAFDEHEVVLLLCGADAADEESRAVHAYVTDKHPLSEVYMIDGGQKIYSFMLVFM